METSTVGHILRWTHSASFPVTSPSPQERAALCGGSSTGWTRRSKSLLPEALVMAPALQMSPSQGGLQACWQLWSYWEIYCILTLMGLKLLMPTNKPFKTVCGQWFCCFHLLTNAFDSYATEISIIHWWIPTCTLKSPCLSRLCSIPMKHWCQSWAPLAQIMQTGRKCMREVGRNRKKNIVNGFLSRFLPFYPSPGGEVITTMM